MENEIVRDDLVALLVEGTEMIGRRRASAYVNLALISHGLEPWEDINIDLFTGRDCCLILARPGNVGHVTVADYALPFLSEFFGT